MNDSIKLISLALSIVLLLLSCVNSKFETGQYYKFIDEDNWTSDEILACEYAIFNVEGSDSTKIIFRKTNLSGQGQAQPMIRTILKSPSKRTYIISVQECNKRNELCYKILPDSAKTGLIGHELVHVQDYKSKGFFAIIWMGIKYSISRKYRTRVEYVTDSLTIVSGLGLETLAFVNYVESSGLASKKYLKRKDKFYMDTEEMQRIVDLYR